MSVTLPPAPPRPPETDDLEALIKEARRRARRRRALYVVSAALAAGAAAAAFAGFDGGGSGGGRGAAANPSAPGSPGQARPGQTPRFTKNGPLAIIDGADSGRIVIVGVRGRLIRSLPICQDPKCGGLTSLAWSPDGKTLAYGTASAASWHPQDGLHLFDIRSKKDRRLDAGYGNWQDLAWSPDGTRLAYVDGASVLVIRVRHPDRPVLVRADSTSPSWAPNGRLAYDRCHGGRTSGIDVARPDGSHVRHLRRFGCAPAWSPDGSRIAYLTRCGIRLATRTGSDVTPNAVWRCTHIGAGGSPSWSPDGREIAASGADGVYVMNANGSGLRMVWPGPAGRPSWRPLPR
jgi:WD40 repeat protein